MDPFTAVSLGISAVGGIAKTIDGFIQAKKQKEQMRKLERSALPMNAFKGLQLPTQGVELAERGIESGFATKTQQLKEAGIRGVMGGLEAAGQAQQKGYMQLGAQLGDMAYDRDIAIAQEDANIEAVREARLRGQIAQTGAALAGAKQQAFSGIADIGSAAGSFGAMRTQELAGDTGSITPKPKKP